MRRFALFVMALLFLAGCVEDLPPVPPPPGQAAGVGGAIAGLAGALPNWAAQPSNAVLNPSQAVFGDGILLTVSNYEYVYKNGYIFNSQRNMWERFELEGEPVDDWLKQSGIATVPVSEQKFKAGENYLVVYACNKVAGKWDCNGNRWMLLHFMVKAPEKAVGALPNVDQYIVHANIAPFVFVSSGGEKDNFEQVIVDRYDAKYRDDESGLIVLVHVFDFASPADLKLTTSTLFKDIINRGWKRHNGQNLALFLDEYDQRVAVWTSGKKIVYVETHTPHFASQEIIDGYLAKYPSDLQKQ